MQQATKRHIVSLVLLAAADGLFFGATNPYQLPSICIIVGFILIALSIYAAARLLLYVVGKYWQVPAARLRRLSVAAGVLGGLLLAMQSIGQLTPKDVIALVPIMALAYFYFSYNRKHTPAKADN